MDSLRSQTCCFTGHRPEKLPWGYDEGDPRCRALKRALFREVEALYRKGYRTFLSGMALGCDLYFAEAVLELAEGYPEAQLAALVPFPEQASHWPEASRRRWQSILDRCAGVVVVSDHYSNHALLRRDRVMVEHSSAILAAYADQPGGTKYTLDYAAKQGLDILLLDVDHPDAPAVRMEREQLNLFDEI